MRAYFLGLFSRTFRRSRVICRLDREKLRKSVVLLVSLLVRASSSQDVPKHVWSVSLRSPLDGKLTIVDSDAATWSPQGRLHQVEYAIEAIKVLSSYPMLT